ncbi:MAG: DUF5041 domain-containing protein [Muribaculaceae bacterium]|nr:DUF5041 domain-containing protein [Muribaculaceae bacterium]
MKKRILYLLTICMCGCMSLFGQSDNAKVLKQIKPSADDYITLLNSSGYEAFSFDISSLTDAQYYISFKIKEYKDGQEIKDDILGGYLTFKNMTLLSEFPDDVQKNIKPEEMADPNRGIYSMGEKIMVGFTPVVNDSIRPILIEVENMASSSPRLKMFPQYENNDSVNGNKYFQYLARPFKTGEITTGKFLPLVLFGSMWYDKDFGIHRFCGENEIDPDMSSKILKYIPHYYIVGIEVNPKKML